MQKNKLSLSRVLYHLLSFLELTVLYFPFSRQRKSLPLVCIPSALWHTFIFSIITSILVYGPVIIFVGNTINIHIFIPELFIISAFGLVFGSIYRSIQSKMTSQIRVDQNHLVITTHGFYERKIEVIDRTRLKSIVLYKEKYRSTKNFKVSAELNDERQVMLELIMFRKRAERLLAAYSNILELPVTTLSKRHIINDAHIRFSG